MEKLITFSTTVHLTVMEATAQTGDSVTDLIKFCRGAFHFYKLAFMKNTRLLLQRTFGELSTLSCNIERNTYTIVGCLTAPSTPGEISYSK